MDLIAGWEKFETAFRGEPVSMQLRPLYTAGYRLIFPYMGKHENREFAEKVANLRQESPGLSIAQASTEVLRSDPGLAERIRGEITGAVDDSLELQGKARDIFDGHVKDITGLTINGAPITAEDLSREVMLSPLAQAILQELFMRSTVTAGEAKNSGEPLTSSTA